MQILKIIFMYLQIRWFSPRTRKNIARMQDRKKRKFHRHLITNIPFYRDYKANDALPVITKSFYRQHFTEFNRIRIGLDAAIQAAIDLEHGQNREPIVETVFAGLSTGTSGSRSVFLTSKSERSRWTSVMLARGLPQPIWHKAKLALLLKANNPLYETTKKSKQLEFSYFNINTDIHQWLPKLIAYQPTLIVAPPAVLLFLAREAKENLKPKYVFSAADILDTGDRNEIEQAFGLKLREIYQATEGFLGVSCQHGTLHLNEDLIQFEQEFIDNDNKYFMPILTDFHRTTQAIARFRLNDILLTKSNPCECGSPLLGLERIDGRSDEIFLIPGKNGGYSKLFRGELICILEPLANGCGDFRLMQTAPCKFTLHTSKAWEKSNIELLRHELIQLWHGADITLEVCENFSVSLAEKRRRIVRTFADPAGVLGV